MRELALHVLDVLENSLEAGASCIELSIDEDHAADRLTIVIRDDGRGMDAAMLRRALDPFFTTRTTRHVGLGLPLFAAAAGRCDGDLRLESEPGRGTTVTATFRHSHLDRAPLGDMTGTLLAFLLSERGQGLRFIYRHRVDERVFELDTDEIRAELGSIPLSHPLVRDWLGEYIGEGEADLATGPATTGQRSKESQRP